MTEEVYKQPLKTFKTDVTPAPVYTVPLLEKGRAALEEINDELGLGFDEWDKDYEDLICKQILGLRVTSTYDTFCWKTLWREMPN